MADESGAEGGVKKRVWTKEDTAFLNATLQKKNKPLNMTYDDLIKLHESLPY